MFVASKSFTGILEEEKGITLFWVIMQGAVVISY
jgi:hypothetical protein